MGLNKPVDFSTAKRLKETGFDKVTNKSYRISINPEIPLPTEPIADEITYFPNVKESYSAPTIAEVVVWLFEKHGIWTYSFRIDISNKFYWHVDTSDEDEFTSDDFFNSPTEAYEAAIIYSLNNLL